METVVFLEEFGAYVTIEDDELLYCAANNDGTPDTDMDGETPNWCEVTAPVSQEFLDAVNVAFGTSYTMGQFAGR